MCSVLSWCEHQMRVEWSSWRETTIFLSLFNFFSRLLFMVDMSSVERRGELTENEAKDTFRKTTTWVRFVDICSLFFCVRLLRPESTTNMLLMKCVHVAFTVVSNERSEQEKRRNGETVTGICYTFKIVACRPRCRSDGVIRCRCVHFSMFEKTTNATTSLRQESHSSTVEPTKFVYL